MVLCTFFSGNNGHTHLRQKNTGPVFFSDKGSQVGVFSDKVFQTRDPRLALLGRGTSNHLADSLAGKCSLAIISRGLEWPRGSWIPHPPSPTSCLPLSSLATFNEHLMNHFLFYNARADISQQIIKWWLGSPTAVPISPWHGKLIMSPIWMISDEWQCCYSEQNANKASLVLIHSIFLSSWLHITVIPYNFPKYALSLS